MACKPTPYAAAYPLSIKFRLAAQAENWLGTIQVGRRNYAEAEALLLLKPQTFSTPGAAMTLNERRLALGHLVKLYEAWGKQEQTATWQKKLDEIAKK